MNETAELRRRLAATAQRVADGEIDLIEGCRAVIRLYRTLGAPETEAFLTLVAIESEVDALPHGLERQNWNPDALEEKDAERSVYLANVGDQVREASRTIANAFQSQH